MATVIINRSSEYINMLRNYVVYIDGKKVGTIANGQTKAFNVSPGSHSIFSKIDWCSSPKISFVVDDTNPKEFEVSGFKYANWLMPLCLGILVLGLLFNPTYQPVYLILGMPGFLFLVYYISAGRKKYLTLTETVNQP